MNMTNHNEMTLPNYIINSLKGAWKIVQFSPKAMDYIDVSSEGFWKSFWAIALIIPVFLFTLTSSGNTEVPQPYLSSTIYLITALPLTAVVMYYFTRFMKISENYIPMIIAYNWLNALSFNIIVVTGLILDMVISGSQSTLFIQALMQFYFGALVTWFMYKISLKIGGFLAFGVLIFEILFNRVYQVLLMKFFDPQAFAAITEAVSNPPA